MSLTLPKIKNYQTEEIIHESDRALVYRGRREENGESVVIKLMRNEYPSFNELVQFRNQYAIAKNLEMDGIIKTYALERYQNRYVLIMEDMKGVSLAEYQRTESLGVSQFLHIAIQFAETLHHLHQNNIIHKDIKPANIIIHPETQQVKLIDFSISTLLPKETQTIQTPNILEGTLAYLSPEQTGRMNRGIDYRSDFYSLGVAFYQLLTGNVPFASEDPLELIHAHIAQNPKPVTSHSIPEILSDIVLKLMAKNAEDRYQSALGLKYDLEKCLVQYQETGKIEPFALGERDRCDRFLIPEKLYGREKEVQILLESFNRIASPATEEGRAEIMLVAGYSGIGKTAIINEVHKPIVKNRGYFIKGKFDQFNRNIPLSAFVQAFRDLMGQLLGESDTELHQWKAKILEAVGENGQVLIDVIPELEQVIGKQPKAPELSGSAAQNRFNLLFEQFIAVFTTKKHPLTLFLDDLQWADSASLNLLKVLMGDKGRGYLLLLGAYRDNEVFPAHPLMLTLAELEKRCDSDEPLSREESKGRTEHLPREQQTNISTLTLMPLSIVYINQLVAETLSCPLEVAWPLTDLIYQKTKGNPFFTTQFLKGLYEDQFITFNFNLGYWECDLVKVRDAALTNDVVEYMVGRLHKLPTATQKVLKFASCIGNQFDLETLAIICETPLEEVAADLWSALREGLVLPQNEAYKFFQGWEKDKEDSQTRGIIVGYRFLHDRVQQAAYSAIVETEKQITHAKIGKLLLKCLSEKERDEKLFDIVNHLNFSIALALANSEIQRNDLAELNLQATRKAKSSTAYEAAVEYASIGLNLFASDSWIQAYQLTLDFYIEAIEVEYLNTNFVRAEQLSEIALEQANDLLDCIPIYILKIQFLIASNQLIQAIETALPILDKLGYPLLQTPEKLRQIAPLPTLENLDKIPEMTDPHQLAALRLLTIITGPAYMGKPEVLPYIIFKLVNLSLECGHSVLAGYGYGMYSLLLCGPLNDIEMGYHAGLLSLQLLEDFHAQEFSCKIHLLFNMIRHWKEPAQNGLAFAETIQKGLEIGDLVYAGYCSMWFATYLFFMGKPLAEIETRQKYYAALMQKYKQDYSFYPISIWRQLTLNLQGRSENVLLLTGESFNEDRMQQLHGLENRMVLFFAYLAKLVLQYTLQNYEAAVQNADIAAQYEDAAPATMLVSGYRFYDALVRLALCDGASALEQDQLMEKVMIDLEQMRVWANHAPANYQHQYDLLKAEKCRVSGQPVEAMELYDRAIAGAKDNEYLQNEALANERAAKFYLDWGKEKFAAMYMQEAYYSYARWGAKAKTDDLEKNYSQLLSPILNFHKKGSNADGTISSTTMETGDLFDYSSLMKASRTIAEEIDLDRAIANLMQVIVENAGAETVALMLLQEQTLVLEAKSAGGVSQNLHPIPVEDSQAVPLSIVNTVKRTRKPLLLDNAHQNPTHAADSYMQEHHPQSVLCIPLLDRTQLRGILYLENNQCSGAFTSDRVEILNLLCAQAAIALENARLYQRSLLMADDLQKALSDLQQTHLQLVQHEKMATLGNLVAGVAHEINNPLGFIGGNVQILQHSLTDLSAIVEGYREEFPEPSPELADEIEELDLDFLLEDIPKTIASMQEGVKRIGNISTSLRTFSRTDTDTQTEFNLHDGLDSTLLILKYRLKANEERPAIEIRKNYGNIPPVKCYAGQLNQVFMNLLANAIDALDESNAGKTYTEIEKTPNCITLTTEFSEDQKNVIVKISDNGKGMPEEVKERIFEQGFTTKKVGKGTGLGMAIAHQIITEKHGGTITCESELGKGTEFIISLP